MEWYAFDEEGRPIGLVQADEIPVHNYEDEEEEYPHEYGGES